MDGRSQRKVADYLSTSFGVRHIDTITTAGAVRHLAEETEQTPILLANLDVSMNAHGSRQIAVVAHHDCAGNRVSAKTQKDQLAVATARLSEIYPDAEVVVLSVNEQSIVEKIRSS